jgi:hypothetical protein
VVCLHQVSNAVTHDNNRQQDQGPWSRPTLARRPVFGQLTASPTSSPLEDQFPTRGIPTRSLSLAGQVSASHDKFSLARQVQLRLARGPRCTAKTQGASTTTDARGGTIPHTMQVQQLAAMQIAHPDKSLNDGLTGCAAIPSPSSPTLPHASSA